MFSPTVMDHFERPRNVGVPKEFTAKGLSGDPSAGPYMIFYLLVLDGVIRDVGFQTYGCGPAIAAGSLLSELVKGLSLEDASRIDSPLLLERLGGLPLGKRHCADIAIAALADGIRKATG